jgi:hypothetical protein
MKNAWVLLGMVIQLAVSCLAFIWILAFLGFTDESKRSALATVLGKFLVILCVLLAMLPIGITLWVNGCYYFSPVLYRQLPLGLFLPVVTIFCCLLFCAGIIYLFKIVGYRKGK